jgi:hypothetical protein
MKNSKKFKIISICVILLVSIFVAIGFYARSKFNSESLKTELVTSLSELYPNLKIELGSLEVDFGINSHIKISKIQLTSKILTSELSNLASFDLIDVNIPVFNILTGGGTIVLEVKKPNIEFRSIEEGTNWSRTFESPTSKDKINSTENSKLPAFLANSQINAHMENLQLSHIDLGGKKNKYQFNEISLKDIGLKRPMAIKLNSNIEISGTQFSLDSIGEFSLKSFLEDRIVSTKAISKISKLSIAEKSINIEEININTNFLFRNDKTGRISFEIKVDSLLETKGEYLILKDEGTLKIENFLISLAGLNKVYPFKPNELDLNDSSVSLDGEVSVSKEGDLKPFLKAKVLKPLFFDTELSKVEIERGLIILTENKVELTSAFSVLKGRGELKLSNDIDINKKINLSGLEPFSISLDLNGLVIKETLVKKVMKPKAKEAKTEKKETASIIPFILDLKLKNIVFMKEILNGKAQISAVKERIAVKNLDLKIAGGSLLVNTTTELSKESMAHKFSIELDQINLARFQSLAPEDMPFATGALKGSVAGNAKKNKKGMTYSAFVKGEVRSGEIVNYNLSEVVNLQLEKINQLPYFNKKPLKKIKIPQNYEKITYDIHASGDEIKIKKLHLIGIKKKIELKSQGLIREKGASEVYVNFFDNKKNYLKFLKEVDMNSFPTRISGPGYELSPDYNYTKKVFIKKAKKRLKKKAKAALKKTIKKETKKIKEKAKSKAKDLLKDLFK